MSRFSSSLFRSLAVALPWMALPWVALPASAVVVFDWIAIGDPRNAGDPQTSCFQCGPTTTFGAVAYSCYPTSSNVAPTCEAPTSTANRANCDAPGQDASDVDVDNLTNVGSFTGSSSPYGTYDQAGIVWEWNEKILSSGALRGVRGGSFAYLPSYTAASLRDACAPNCDVVNYGIRVATSVPEPGWDVLLMAGMFGIALASWRRRRD